MTLNRSTVRAKVVSIPVAIAVVMPVKHLRPRRVHGVAFKRLTRPEKPVPRDSVHARRRRDATKQEHYDEDSKQASNPSRAARDGAYARTAIPKFSGGGGGSASTTRSMS